MALQPGGEEYHLTGSSIQEGNGLGVGGGVGEGEGEGRGRGGRGRGRGRGGGGEGERWTRGYYLHALQVSVPTLLPLKKK